MATVPMGQADSGFDILEKGLKPGALGLLSSTVIALASVAPAYSLAATIAQPPIHPVLGPKVRAAQVNVVPASGSASLSFR